MCDKRRKNPLKNVTNLLNKILCNLFSVLLFFTKKDPIFDFFTPFYAPKMWITMWICGLSPLFTDILTMWLFENCFLKISCQGKIINKILSHFYLKIFLKGEIIQYYVNRSRRKLSPLQNVDNFHPVPLCVINCVSRSTLCSVEYGNHFGTSVHHPDVSLLVTARQTSVTD